MFINLVDVWAAYAGCLRCSSQVAAPAVGAASSRDSPPSPAARTAGGSRA